MRTSDHEVDAHVRDVIGVVDPSPQERDAELQRRLLAEHEWRRDAGAGVPRPSRPRRLPRGVAVAIAVAVISISTVALAQPAAVKQLLGVEDTPPPAERMEVFDEPASLDLDDLPEPLRGMFDHQFPPGDEIDAADLHAALTYRSDGLVVRLYSAPTRNDQACMIEEIMVGGQTRSAGASCSLAMRYNGHVTVGYRQSVDIGALVTGLADDEVRQVRVRLSDGRILDAEMGRNAYLLHLPSADVQTRGLLVELHDGSVVDVAMNGCLRSQLEPPLKSRLGCGFGMNKGPGDAVG